MPPQRLHEHFYFRGSFWVEINDFRFAMVNYNTSIETDIFWRGWDGYESESMHVWARLCRNASVILDVGANTGLFSLVAKAVNPDAHIYSFEPIRRFYDKLVVNCRLNAWNINCRDFALSNRDGKAVIYDLPFEHHYHASLNQSDAAHASTQLIPQPIQTKTLKTVVAEEGLKRVDLIKIDVEGWEPEVLEGLGDQLDRLRPALLIEIKSDERAQRIETMLDGLDYSYFDIDDVNGLTRVEHLARSSALNCLMCPRSTAEQLGL